MEITKELFDEAVEIEDSLDALANGYYDTHDLDFIESQESDYKDRLNNLKALFNLKDDEYFCNFKFEDFGN